MRQKAAFGVFMSVVIVMTFFFATSVTRGKDIIVNNDVRTDDHGRLLPPSSLESYTLDRWVTVLRDQIYAKRTSFVPETVPGLLVEITTLEKSDEAIYYFALGLIYDRFSRMTSDYANENYAKALENYTKAIALNGNVAMFYHFRGQVRFFYAISTDNDSLYNDALIDYRMSAKLDPNWPMPVNAQGWCALNRGNIGQAEVLFKKALKIDPCSCNSLMGLLEINKRRSDADPENIDFIQQGLGYAGQIRNAPDDSLKTLHKQESLEMMVPLVTVLEMRQKALQPKTEGSSPFDDDTRLKKPENTDFQTMCRWNGELMKFLVTETDHHPEYLKTLIGKYTQLVEGDGAVYYYAQGYVFDYFSRKSASYRDENFNASVENYSKAIDRADDVAYFYHFRGQAFYFYAKNTGENDFYNTAINNYLKAEKLDPTWPMPLVMQGWSHDALGEHEKAYKAFSKALKIDPNQGEAKRGIAMLQGKYPKLYDEGVVNDMVFDDLPLAQKAERLLIAAFSENGDRTQQETSATQQYYAFVEKEYVDHADLLIEAARLAEYHSHFEKATAFYQQYTELMPFEQAQWEMLFECYQKLENTEKMLEVLTQLIALDPNDIEHWLDRARYTAKINNYSTETTDAWCIRAISDLSFVINKLEDYSSSELKEKQLQAYVWRAELDEMLGRWDHAFDSYSKAITPESGNLNDRTFEALCPDKTIVPYIEAARVSALKKDKNLAILFCTDMIKRCGRELPLLRIRADAYYDSGNFEKAIDDYNTLLIFEKNEDQAKFLNKKIIQCYEKRLQKER